MKAQSRKWADSGLGLTILRPADDLFSETPYYAGSYLSEKHHDLTLASAYLLPFTGTAS